ncbi:Cellulose-growth-specific protein [Lachnellula suecica]|uniref:AA9 family lytic polysaccharide monooxygenase n=1 Tax=Lachnellula suecica TaxID=602035 RepID=A0A8T9CID7_9HELO|nr:Cellulose-growth-specific protein [Lachnellula suecica]
MSLAWFLFTAALAYTVSAHGGVSNYTVDGTWYRGYSPYDPPEWQDGQSWLIGRKWTSINPVFQPDNISVACNAPGNPAPASIPINAGDNITAVYYYWLHTVGPMIVWMADCHGPCSDFNATEGDWFKIAQEGLISGTVTEGTWYQRQFQEWDGSASLWPETIPATLKPGNYLIRHEIIALHIANKPQWYPECAHLVVSGNGTDVPGEEYLAKIPGVWSLNQPEINIDIYSDAWINQTTYNIPGPPVWRGNSVTS